MKKVILSAAALMIGAIGFAQEPGANQATPVANQNPVGHHWQTLQRQTSW